MSTELENVVNFFLAKDTMTHKKLQKIVYYAYSWTLALLNESDDIQFTLFDEKFQAWVHVPVCPELYNEYKSYGWEEINTSNEFNNNVFSEEVINILDQVWDVYGGYNANELESITHQ